MRLCLIHFPPATDFENYLEAWLRAQGQAHAGSIQLLHETQFKGAKSSVPPPEEIMAMASRDYSQTRAAVTRVPLASRRTSVSGLRQLNAQLQQGAYPGAGPEVGLQRSQSASGGTAFGRQTTLGYDQYDQNGQQGQQQQYDQYEGQYDPTYDQGYEGGYDQQQQQQQQYGGYDQQQQQQYYDQSQYDGQY
jgi:hypothetical protein